MITRTWRRSFGVLAVGILLVTAAYGLFGQSGAHPSFEVASIKRNTLDRSESARHAMGVGYQPGGRLTAQNASLMLLIQFAYADRANPMNGHWLPLPVSQVAAGPAWMRTEAYDIDAKPKGNSDERHTWLMLQTLLADRFKLKLHRETRELPIYDLTVAKSGSKCRNRQACCPFLGIGTNTYSTCNSTTL